jgi:hypothetical protein
MFNGHFLPVTRLINIACKGDVSGSRAVARQGKKFFDFCDLTPDRSCLFWCQRIAIVRLTKYLQSLVQMLRQSFPSAALKVGPGKIMLNGHQNPMKKAAVIADSGFNLLVLSGRTCPTGRI